MNAFFRRCLLLTCLFGCAEQRHSVMADKEVELPTADLPRPCNARDCVPPLPNETVDGDPLDGEMLIGKVVVVVFWTTYCNDCLDLFPRLAQMQARYAGKPVTMIGVLEDITANDAQALAARQRSEIAFPQVRFTPRMAAATGAEGILPLLALYGKDGRLMQRWMGNIDVGAVESSVDGILAGR